MINFRCPLYVTTALVSGVVAGLFGSATARAQCGGISGSGSSTILVTRPDLPGDDPIPDNDPPQTMT
jgi:hypothetical protein